MTSLDGDIVNLDRNDLPEMVALCEATQRDHVAIQPKRFRSNVPIHETEATIREYFKPFLPWRRRTNFAVGWRSEKLLGYVLYSYGTEGATRDTLSRDFVHVTDIAVDPDARRSGLARRLLDHVISHARELKADDVVGVVWGGNDASKSLFEGAGFETEFRLFALRLDDEETP